MVVVTWVYEFAKIHFKLVHFLLCKLYLIKLILNEVKDYTGLLSAEQSKG